MFNIFKRKPKWLVKLLLSIYWKLLPWGKYKILADYGYDLNYEWVPVKSLIGKPGYSYKVINNEIYTCVYNKE